MSRPEATKPVEGNEEEIAVALRGSDTLLVALDFDGTLAPIRHTPGTVTMDRTCRAAVEQLLDSPGVAVGIVSGRELADLKSRVEVEDVFYAGNHGLELERDGVAVTPRSADRWQLIVDDAVESLQRRLADVPGAFVEDKGLTVAVHYRNVPQELVHTVRSTVETAVGDDDTLDIHEGKEIVEVRPATDWDKGSAVLYVASHVARDVRILYLGDDVTDEDAFSVLGDRGVGIHVGDRAETAADYRLPDQERVGPFLEWVAGEVIQATEQAQDVK